MKNKMLSILLGLSAVAALGLTGCNNNPTPTPSSSESSSSTSPSSSDTSSSTSESTDPTPTSTGTEPTSTGTEPTSTEPGPGGAPLATGAKQFVDASYEDRTEILGTLEKYVIDHNLAGLPLYQSGGYQLYQDRVVKGTPTYVPGYGFSILRDGYLNGNLEGETMDQYQNYWHEWNSSDPTSINALNSDGSQISDLYSEQSSGYFGTRLTEDKTGYEWYGVNSKYDRPLAVDSDGNVKAIEDTTSEELHPTWRVYVRTGVEGGVAYHSSSEDPGRAAFSGTYAVLDDYLTPFKLLLNQANGLYRGNELAKQTGKSGFVGAQDYFKATANAAKGIADASWAKVGIQGGTDDLGDYVEFTFLVPVNRFYAMYGTASDLYQPVPAGFIDAIGGIDNYGNYAKDESSTPVDNILSCGPYYIESWDKDQLITFHRNDLWWERVANPDLYRIEGIHQRILSGYDQDKAVGIKAFLANQLDSAGVPDGYEDLWTDPRAVQIAGSSTFKLNINSCTPERWEELFGVNGEITKTPADKYWDVKPWMSNQDFLMGLAYSIDRETYASSRGSFPSINFYADAYQSNPEEGISYNSTQAHADALSGFWGDTVETFGYSESLAVEEFKLAIEQLVEDGVLTAESDDLGITIEWMYAYQVEDEGAEIAGYMEDAFNAAAEELGYDFQLVVTNECTGTSYLNVYYDHLMVGQFDLGFGSISGNTLDPLNFMDVLMSNNKTGFTLNWGPDTSIPDNDLETGLIFEGEAYSFDNLYAAADHGVIIDEEGYEIPALQIDRATAGVYDPETGLVTVSGKVDIYDDPALFLDFMNVCGMMTTDYSDYFEVYPDGSSYSETANLYVYGYYYHQYKDRGYVDTQEEVDEDHKLNPAAAYKAYDNDGSLIDANLPEGLTFDVETGEFSFVLGLDDSALAGEQGFLYLSSDVDMYIDGVYLGMNSASWAGVRVTGYVAPQEPEDTSSAAESSEEDEGFRFELASANEGFILR